MWAGFFCRQDVSISIFGRTKEFSEVRGTSLMCNFGVHSRFLDVIYGVRPPNGSPEFMKIRTKIAKLQMHENVHKNVNENTFSFIFCTNFDEFL